MKYIANIITVIRILLSILLLFFFNNTLVFIIIYLICGISDVVDGIVARKTNTVSTLGAKLDSIADFLMFGMITIFLIIWGEELKKFLLFIIIIVIVRLVNLFIAAIKYHSFIMLHTWGNKITGLLIFIAPAFFVITHHTEIILFVCTVAMLSALEEGMLHITSKTPDLNKRSIFHK